MPTYEYKCTVCNFKAEIKHGINKDALLYCPSCGGFWKRQISETAPPQFKQQSGGTWAESKREKK